MVPAVRLHVREMGHASTDPREVVKVQLDPCLVRDGKQMEHGVSRAAERHHCCDGVLEGLPRHDLPGSDALSNKPITATPLV